jgi:hypothetical protein
VLPLLQLRCCVDSSSASMRRPAPTLIGSTSSSRPHNSSRSSPSLGRRRGRAQATGDRRHGGIKAPGGRQTATGQSSTFKQMHTPYTLLLNPHPSSGRAWRLRSITYCPPLGRGRAPRWLDLLCLHRQGGATNAIYIWDMGSVAPIPPGAVDGLARHSCREGTTAAGV